MKNVILIVFALFAVAASAAYDLPDGYKKIVSNRRVCVRREVVGDNVITYWERNGRPDWIRPAVETNALKHIRGKKQNNPTENERDAAIVEKNEAIVERDAAVEEAKPARAVKEAKKNASKKDAKNLEKAIQDMEKAKSKSSESMAALYDAILSLLYAEEAK